MNEIALHVGELPNVALHVETLETKNLSVGAKFYNIGVPEYRGSYYVTPTSEEITMQVEGMKMSHDVVIAPIPENYGLITWDGSTLTVS